MKKFIKVFFAILTLVSLITALSGCGTSVKVGDTITLGMYHQDAIEPEARQPIEWLVIDKSGSKLLVVSSKAIDSMPYHHIDTDITWENCSLRSWLNSDFIEFYFTPEEQSMLVPTEIKNSDNPDHGTPGGNNTTDKVFLLSIDEAKEYFDSDSQRVLTPTDYIKSIRNYNSSCQWLLRSPGINSTSVARVGENGEIFTGAADTDGDGVYEYCSATDYIYALRPAMWIEFK